MRAAVENCPTGRTDDMREASRLPARLAHRRLLGTKTAFDQRPQLTSPTFFIEYPRPHLERRVMAHVSLMPAGELGDPKTVLVPVETNDRTLHVLHGMPEPELPTLRPPFGGPSRDTGAVDVLHPDVSTL